MAERGGPGRLRGHTSTSRQAALHPPKPNLGCAVGARPPLPHRRAEEARERPASGSAPRWARTAPRIVPAPRAASSPRLAPGAGPGAPVSRAGGRSLRGDAAARAADPGSLECAFVQWGRQCQRRRVTSARSVRTRRRRRTRPRPRAHVTRPPRGPEPGSRDPRAAGRVEGRGENSVFARAQSRGAPAPAPSRKGSGKRRADAVLRLRAHTLLLGKLQGTGGACVLPKTRARVKAFIEEFK